MSTTNKTHPEQYDPFQHAEQMGILVHWVELPGAMHGLWTGEDILIDPRLTNVQARSALAHELVHAEYDAPLIRHEYTARVEARADRQAALRLINDDEYQRAVRVYPYENQVAQELGVTKQLLRAYQTTLTA